MTPLLLSLVLLLTLSTCMIALKGKAMHLQPHSIRSTRLRSLGDPNLSFKWTLLRKLQPLYRKIDSFIFKDPDVPGMSFVSPIIWAPWMDTIWFGNIYDYRSSFFNDVMYSQAAPFKEGALLFSDSSAATSLALLYQRYKKFDSNCYTVENATFYNIFGVETVRIGRYKVPLSTDVIIATTDPLTISDMKRYFNSFAPIKYFRSLFMQQKRKRQYIMTVGGEIHPETFVVQAVHKLEYGLILDLICSNDKEINDRVLTLPLLPNAIKFENSVESYRFSVSVANSQHILERIFQGYFNTLSNIKPLTDMKILIGGDGRTLNEFALNIFLRVAAGNLVKEVVVEEGNLSTAAAQSAVFETKFVDSAIILTAPDSSAGLLGDFGIRFVGNRSIFAALGSHIESIENFKISSKIVNFTFQKSNSPLKVLNTAFNTLSTRQGYIDNLTQRVSLRSIRSIIESLCVVIAFDCNHGVASNYLPLLFDKLGITDSSKTVAFLIHSDHRADYYNKDPGRVSKDSMDLFGVEPFSFEYLIESLLVEAPQSVRLDEGTPDIGVVFNADASSCSIVVPGYTVINPFEVKEIVNANEYDIADADGIATALQFLAVVHSELQRSELPFERALKSIVHKHRVSGNRKTSLEFSMSDISVEVWNSLFRSLYASQRTSERQLKYFPPKPMAYYKTLSRRNNVELLDNSSLIISDAVNFASYELEYCQESSMLKITVSVNIVEENVDLSDSGRLLPAMIGFVSLMKGLVVSDNKSRNRDEDAEVGSDEDSRRLFNEDEIYAKILSSAETYMLFSSM